MSSGKRLLRGDLIGKSRHERAYEAEPAGGGGGGAGGGRAGGAAASWTPVLRAKGDGPHPDMGAAGRRAPEELQGGHRR